MKAVFSILSVTLQGKSHTDIAATRLQESLENVQRGEPDLSQPRVTPRIAAIEQHDLVPAVQDDITRLRGHL